MSNGVTSLPPQLISSDRLAERLGMSRKALYHAHNAGQIPPGLKIGNRLRWRVDVINTWLAELEETETEFRGRK